MVDFINFELGRPGFGWYHQFLRHMVLPHATFFSYLVMTGEAIAGILLLTGAVTRVGAAIAMLLFVNYMFAKGRWFWSAGGDARCGRPVFRNRRLSRAALARNSLW